MITTEINYKGKGIHLPYREKQRGRELIIARTSLPDVLMPYPATDGSDGYADKEAEKVDEDIFFYTADSNLGLPDDALIEELKEDNPEWFD